MVVLRDIFILKIFRWGAEARSSDEMRVVSEILPKCQVVSEKLPFFLAESLVVVWREESREKITSVGKRLSTWWSSGARFTWDLWFFGQVLVVVARDVHLGLVIFRPSVGKFEKVQRQRSARRDKSSGPLPFLFDVLYFCIFKIHFPSQIQLSSRFCPDMPLSFSFATILPPEPPYCFSRLTFLHRYKYEFIYLQYFARISTYLGQTP